VKAFRTRAAKAETALVVAIDADTGTVATRQRQLAALLDSAEITPRLIAEPIVHLIPRRNVETWILCLTGTRVNEGTDYKTYDPGIDQRIKPAALKLFDWSRLNATPDPACVSSLHDAIAELNRLS
jgi:hypothetical protein